MYKYQNLIKNINNEKSKPQPDTIKIEQYQINLEEIENYKKQGTTIRSKENIILNEEKPTKYFFIQEKTKAYKKHITCIQNEQGELLTTNSNTLKECKNYFQTLYTKHNTCEKTQNFS